VIVATSSRRVIDAERTTTTASAADVLSPEDSRRRHYDHPRDRDSFNSGRYSNHYGRGYNRHRLEELIKDFRSRSLYSIMVTVENLMVETTTVPTTYNQRRHPQERKQQTLLVAEQPKMKICLPTLARTPVSKILPIVLQRRPRRIELAATRQALTL